LSTKDKRIISYFPKYPVILKVKNRGKFVFSFLPSNYSWSLKIQKPMFLKRSYSLIVVAGAVETTVGTTVRV